uniref:Uncharacterized protein n=1 Tax=Ixodes ricinus TaxID=34613 RepID=A0A0K8RAU4_IXORI
MKTELWFYLQEHVERIALNKPVRFELPCCSQVLFSASSITLSFGPQKATLKIISRVNRINLVRNHIRLVLGVNDTKRVHLAEGPLQLQIIIPGVYLHEGLKETSSSFRASWTDGEHCNRTCCSWDHTMT